MMEKTVIQQSVRKREIWVDNVKVFACMVVLVGHVLQGLDSAGIFPNHTVFVWINRFLYAFHVPLFFICSGYLYQKYSEVRNARAWKQNVVKKLLDLGVPYVSFTIAVWLIKKAVPGAGTNTVLSLWENLFLEPIPPFWYLYALFLCFLVTPTLRSGKRTALLWAGSVVVMFAVKKGFFGHEVPQIVGYFCSHYQWFLVGMGLAMGKPEWVPKAKWVPIVLGGCFLVLGGIFREGKSTFVWLVCSLLACSAVVIFNFWKEKQGKLAAFLSPYTMPIFLMHSVFGAFGRTLLLKCGITGLGTHLVLGIVCALAGPIIAAQIMGKLKFPEFFLYPRKFIRLK